MNLGFSGEIAFIMLLALVLFGPRKLAELSRQAGRLMAQVRAARNNLQTQIQDEIGKLQLEDADPAKHLAPALQEANRGLDDVSLGSALDRLTTAITNFSSPNDQPGQSSQSPEA